MTSQYAGGRSRPHLILNNTQLEALKQGGSEAQREALKQVRLACDAGLLTEPVPESLIGTRYEVRWWSVELDVIREYLQSILNFALGALVFEDERYLTRAKRELLALCGWSRWIGGDHDRPDALGFALETGEACLAVGLGYDWLYPYFSSEERTLVRDGLIRNGLEPYRRAVLENSERAWWCEVEHNWNTVCHGGATVGALALLDEYPHARELVDAARHYIPRFTDHLGTDGGWSEGTGYWAYGVGYLVWYGLALRSAQGDGWVFEVPGLAHTGDFFLAFCPNGEGSGFGDVSAGPMTAGRLSLLSILGHEFGRPEYHWYKQRFGGYGPLDVLSVNDNASPPPSKSLWVFESVGWAALTSDLGDPDQCYLALKSGDLRANHAHNDLNSFVLWAYSEKLIVNLAHGAYTAEYFEHSNRERIYQTSTRAHNTLLIDGQGQSSDAHGQITHATAEEGVVSLVAECGTAYQNASRVERRVSLLHGEFFTLRDEVEAPQPVTVSSLLHTFGEVELTGHGFLITQGAVRLEVQVEAPECFELSVTRRLIQDGFYAGREERVLCVEAREMQRHHLIILALLPSKLASVEGG